MTSLRDQSWVRAVVAVVVIVVTIPLLLLAISALTPNTLGGPIRFEDPTGWWCYDSPLLPGAHTHPRPNDGNPAGDHPCSVDEVIATWGTFKPAPSSEVQP